MMDTKLIQALVMLPRQTYNHLETLWMSQVSKLLRGPKDPAERNSTYMDFSVSDHLLRLKGEILELEVALSRKVHPASIWKEAADVSNFAAFVAARYAEDYKDAA